MYASFVTNITTITKSVAIYYVSDDMNAYLPYQVHLSKLLLKITRMKGRFTYKHKNTNINVNH